MREIKFRIPHYDFEDNFIMFTYWGRLEKGIFTSPSTVNIALIKKPDEQYSGLKDKNGVEIYEGDRVRIIHPCWHEIVNVLFEDGSFIFKTKKESVIPGWTIYREKWELEIISNIHKDTQ